MSDSPYESQESKNIGDYRIKLPTADLPELPEHLKRKQPKRRRNTIKHPKFKVHWTPEEVSCHCG